MKTIMLLIMSIFSLASTQNIYKVEPGIKGNKIILTVENVSTTLGIANLKLTETNRSPFIEMKTEEYLLPNLEKSSEKEIEIEFNVLSEAEINKEDTLNFKITDNKGNTWNKEIILEYIPPKEYLLFQNYPNPFNPSTTIRYSIPAVETEHSSSLQNVTLKVYDILGREVATLVNEEQQPGNYEVIFNANRLASGTYFYRLSSGTFVKTMKFVLLK